MTALLANLLGLLGTPPSTVTPSSPDSKSVVSNNAAGSTPGRLKDHVASLRAKYNAERNAAFTLGLWHGLAGWPFVYLWFYGAGKLVEWVFGSEQRPGWLSLSIQWAGEGGIYLFCLAAAIALFRYGWYSMVDVIWSALGCTPVDYGKYTTGDGRRKGRTYPHTNGFFLIFFAISFVWAFRRDFQTRSVTP